MLHPLPHLVLVDIADDLLFSVSSTKSHPLKAMGAFGVVASLNRANYRPTNPPCLCWYCGDSRHVDGIGLDSTELEVRWGVGGKLIRKAQRAKGL